MPATLTSLRIRNLALVEDLSWTLTPGFTAITGETGSGKSIIVGALQLILGERADKSLVRAGAESCAVEAVFQFTDARALNVELEEGGVEPCEGGELILKRVFAAGGANRQFINGSPTTLAVLKHLGDGLVDLHGPHDHQSILSDLSQLALLDSFAHAGSLREDYEKHFRQFSALQAEHDELANSEAALEREIDLLRHQVREIESAQLQAGEEEEVLGHYHIAANSRRLFELGTDITGRLAEAEGAVLARLNEIGKLLRELERIDPGTASLGESQLRAATELEDLARSLQSYLADLETDPAQLARIEERVSLFETLKRKYGGSIAAVISFGEQAAARLHKIESRGAEVARLASEMESALKNLLAAGKRLGEKRQAAAPRLAQSVMTHLRDLGFKKSDFQVAVTSCDKPGPHGLEAVAFLFAPNPGEPPKPLKTIASSGEISRVMLAVKSSLAAQDTIPVLVFDEIDANVGGEIAHAVGAKMKSLRDAHQVLCISHLPQVAAQADTQFVVTKEFKKDRTISRLEKVDGKGRIEEIARMLGGQSESALAHARALLGANHD